MVTVVLPVSFPCSLNAPLLSHQTLFTPNDSITITTILMGSAFDLFDRHCNKQNGLHTHFAHQRNVCYGDCDRVNACEQVLTLTLLPEGGLLRDPADSGCGSWELPEPPRLSAGNSVELVSFPAEFGRLSSFAPSRCWLKCKYHIRVCNVGIKDSETSCATLSCLSD